MYQQLQCLVLNGRVSNEADKLVTLYSREWGKITALVPGAKKIGAKLSAATEPVTESEVAVYVRNLQSRAKVTGARIVDNFAALRTDWRRLSIAQSCSEITQALTPFNAENEKKYALLARTWKLLESAAHPWWIYSAFVLRFLRLSGYSFLEYLKSGAGGVPLEEIKIIHKLSVLPGEEIDLDLDISRSMERDILRHLDAYMNLYVPRPLAAKEFWEKVAVKL